MKLDKVMDGLVFPEGPSWDGKGHLFVSNCHADYVTKVDLDGHHEIVYRATDPGSKFLKTNGMTVYKDGSLFACDFGKKAIIRFFPDGQQEILTTKELRGPNDLAFSPFGDLYFTDPAGTGKANPVGEVYRLNITSGELKIVAKGLAFPNGLAFTPDGKGLILAESQTHQLHRFDLQTDGALTNKRLFFQLEDGIEPDGMGFDAEGHLWVAPYGATDLLCLSPTGDVVYKVASPGKQTTNVEFAGPNLEWLYVTEAQTGGLYRMSAPTPGMKLFCAP